MSKTLRLTAEQCRGNEPLQVTINSAAYAFYPDQDYTVADAVYDQVMALVGNCNVEIPQEFNPGAGVAVVTIKDGKPSLTEEEIRRQINAGTAVLAISEGTVIPLRVVGDAVTGEANGMTVTIKGSNAIGSLGSQVISREFVVDSTGGGASVGDGSAAIKSIKGNTVFIQQIFTRSASGTTSFGGGSFAAESDGSLTLAEGVYSGETSGVAIGVFTCKSGHKYYIKGLPAPETLIKGTGIRLSTGDRGNGMLYTAKSNSSYSVKLYCDGVSTLASDVNFFPQVFDLTAAFGAGNEPTDVLFLARTLPTVVEGAEAEVALAYVGGDLGSTGYNAYNPTTGFARVIRFNGERGGNNGYELNGAYTAVKFALDADDLDEGITLTPETYVTERGDTVVRICPPENGYVKISGGNDTTCLHLIWSGNRSGRNYAYAPYSVDSIDVSPDGLCDWSDGALACNGVYDEILPDKCIKRVGIIDLGSLTWKTVVTDSTTRFYTDGLKTEIKIADGQYKTNVRCAVLDNAEFAKVSTNAAVGMAVGPTSGRLWVVTATEYESPTALKTALTGHKLVYELGEYVTTTFDAPLDLTYDIEDNGVEEISGTASAPAIMDIQYPTNAKDATDRLSSDYVTRTALVAILTQVMSAIGVAISDDNGVITVDANGGVLPVIGSSDGSKFVKTKSDKSGYTLSST